MEFEKHGSENDSWLRKRIKPLKALRQPMMVGTGFGWMVGGTYIYLAVLSYRAGLTSHAWAWSISALVVGILVPFIMFELMRIGEGRPPP